MSVRIVALLLWGATAAAAGAGCQSRAPAPAQPPATTRAGRPAAEPLPQPLEAQPPSLAPDAAVRGRCASQSDCAFGEQCWEGACRASECHDGKPDAGVAARPCPAGSKCEYEDGLAIERGNGFCVPLRRGR